MGPALVFLILEHAFLGRGIILQSVTPLEPLLQKVVHTIYYQKNMPAVIPKFLLRAECLQVRPMKKRGQRWSPGAWWLRGVRRKSSCPCGLSCLWETSTYGQDPSSAWQGLSVLAAQGTKLRFSKEGPCGGLCAEEGRGAIPLLRRGNGGTRIRQPLPNHRTS